MPRLLQPGSKKWILIHETWRAFFGFVHILGIYASTPRTTRKLTFYTMMPSN